jgi:hypothetical protein
VTRNEEVRYVGTRCQQLPNVAALHCNTERRDALTGQYDLAVVMELIGNLGRSQAGNRSR